MTIVTTLLHVPAKAAADLLVGKGLPLFQACGILASIQGESAFNPRAVGDHDHAFGLCQIHADRAALIMVGCGIDLLTLPPLPDQIEGIWYELHHSEKRALARLLATTTAYAAGDAVCRYYERPAKPDVDCPKRAGWAQDWYAALGPAS